jgi:predicted GTPase
MFEKRDNTIGYKKNIDISQADINGILESLKQNQLFKDKVKNLDNIHNELNNKEFKIAIVANMSSGKSTFVNALFGQEILPSFNEATTDCPTYIHSGTGKKNNLIVNFDDEKKSVNIVNNITEEIKQYARKDIDGLEDKYKNVRDIHLYYDFKNLKKSDNLNFEFTFIDTAGPNNLGDFASKHQNFTKDIIENEADFVIFLFDYGQLDASLDSDELGLWTLLKNRRDKDPFFGVIFVINKIDMAMSDNESDKKKIGYYEDRAVEKLKDVAQNRHGFKNPMVFGVASLYALLFRSDKNSKRFQKILFDFQQAQNPEKALLEYSKINHIEKIILNFINKSINNILIKKAKSNLLEVINETYNHIIEEETAIFKNRVDLENEIDKLEKFQNSRLEENIDSIKEKMDKLFDETLHHKKSQIELLFEEHLDKDLDDIFNHGIEKSLSELSNSVKFNPKLKNYNFTYSSDINPIKVKKRLLGSLNQLTRNRKDIFIGKLNELKLDKSCGFIEDLNTIYKNDTSKLFQDLSVEPNIDDILKEQFAFFENLDFVNLDKFMVPSDLIHTMTIREVKHIKSKKSTEKIVVEDGYKIEQRIEQNGVQKVLKKIDTAYSIENIPKYKTVDVKVPKYKTIENETYEYEEKREDSYRIILQVEEIRENFKNIIRYIRTNSIKKYEKEVFEKYNNLTDNYISIFDNIKEEFSGDIPKLKDDLKSIDTQLNNISNKKVALQELLVA